MYERTTIISQEKLCFRQKSNTERGIVLDRNRVREIPYPHEEYMRTEIENKNKNSFDELRNLIFKKSLRRKIKIIKIQYAADSNILISFAEITSLLRFVILFFWNLIGVAPI